MSKVLNLKINNCNECPYYSYNEGERAMFCLNPDNPRLLYTYDGTDNTNKLIQLGKEVDKDCPLENES